MNIVSSQEVNPNGYNKFYYIDGSLASEGNFENGKPAGEWVTYFQDGTIKSKGEKVKGFSEGDWLFFDEKGRKSWKYEYEKDVKNGCAQRFDTLGNVIEEFYYINGVVQGVKTWYFPNGKISKTVQITDGKEVGEFIEYNEQGDVITIAVYDNGFLKKKETYNRYDKNGEKTGLWREFFPDGSIKSEKNYKDGKLDGISKEFDKKGRLVDLSKMVYGKVDTATGINLLELYKEFHPNGKKKLIGGIKDGYKEGIYRLYDENGLLVTGYLYKRDTMIAEGFISPEGVFEGSWKLYYTTGGLKAEGDYKNGVKEGEWIFYYPNGKVEQKGKLSENKHVGSWIWYYQNGQVKRTEFYNRNSALEGTVTEYDSLGNEIARGDYYNGNREGDWFYHVNDYKEVGSYTIGLQDGIWKSYYENGKLHWVGEYSEGEPKGKHIYYHSNGLKKQIGKYVGGEKHGIWRVYDKSGQEIETIIYKQGEIYKINGFKVIPVEED